MSAAILWSWWLIVILAVLYVGAALHAGLSMRRYGRRWWVWFGLSVLLTVVPTVVCSYVEDFRRVRRRGRDLLAEPGGSRTCRHCGAVLADRGGPANVPGAAPPDEPAKLAGQSVCPECGMALEDEHLA